MTDTKKIAAMISKLQTIMDQAKSMPHADKAITAVIKRQPGLQRALIAKQVGLTPEQCGRVLERLARSGEVMCIGQRRAARWYLWSQLEAVTG